MVSGQAQDLMTSLAKDEPYQVLDGRDSYRGGLAIGTAETMQGLEFDAMILWQVEEDMYPGNSPHAAKRLYIAMTRARKAVTVCAVHELSTAEQRAAQQKHIDQQYQNTLKEIQKGAHQQEQKGQPWDPSHTRELQQLAKHDYDDALANLPPEHLDDMMDAKRRRPSEWLGVLFPHTEPKKF